MATVHQSEDPSLSCSRPRCSEGNGQTQEHPAPNEVSSRGIPEAFLPENRLAPNACHPWDRRYEVQIPTTLA
jgi:hypothetical protein